MNPILTMPYPQGPQAPVRAKVLVFEDPVSCALLDRADRVGDSDAPVLIVGETGTGKELLARHVHARSGRRGPFVAVNCGALTPTLIEAELFGHEAGAYTGAGRGKAGWFESAQGGTLFLDEVGELPLAMQVKLLRVLQEHQVVRVGAREPIDINVRVVAATNVRLEQAVEKGEFRRDLYYRLHVALLELPPLASRPLDIPPLVGYFMAQYAQHLRIDDVRLDDAAMQALLAYAWPGNIRELENVIHCALLLKRGGVIHASDLPFGRLTAVADTSGDRSADARATINKVPAGPAVAELDGHIGALANALRTLFDSGGPRLLERVEQMAISLAYESCNRNQVHTAELLDITRNVLRTQLKRFGLLGRSGTIGEGLHLLAAPAPTAAANAPVPPSRHDEQAVMQAR